MEFERISYIEKVINNRYGDSVSVLSKKDMLRQSGRNSDIDAAVQEQVWEVGGTETLSTTNDITHFASSNAGDTQAIVVEGYTIDGSNNLTFVSQTATLAGQTKTALTTPLARVTKLYNDSATDFAGDIYVSKDVAYTSGVPGSGIHMKVPVGSNQSFKGATSVADGDYWIVDKLIFSVRRSAAATVDFLVQVREKGKVFRTRFSCTMTNGTRLFDLQEPIIIKPNSDVRILATSNTNNTVVDAQLDGYLAETIL